MNDSSRKIIIFDAPHILANDLTKKWRELAENAIRQRGQFNVALSGGRTPVEFYSKLSALDDYGLWSKTHVYLADERFVPYDSPESNFKMIRDNLLNYVNIPDRNVHPVPNDCDNAGIAAEMYKNVLVENLSFQRNNLPSFDFILLGAGEDGHTASLFPGVRGIDDPHRVTIPVSLNHLKDDRVSLTLSVINNARHVFILVVGKKKAAIVKHILEDGLDVPAARVAPADGECYWLLDRDSAQELKNREKYLLADVALLSGE